MTLGRNPADRHGTWLGRLMTAVRGTMPHVAMPHSESLHDSQQQDSLVPRPDADAHRSMRRSESRVAAADGLKQALDRVPGSRAACRQLIEVERCMAAQGSDLAALGQATLGSAMCQARYLKNQWRQPHLDIAIRLIEAAHIRAKDQRLKELEAMAEQSNSRPLM